MLGAARGYRVMLCVPSNVTEERKRLLHAYGAELIVTDPMEGSDGAIREVRRRYELDPQRYFYPDQYSNPANWRAHYDTTAVEIIEQTGGRVTHFVAGLGTGGTFIGTSRRLREWRPSVQLVSVQPESALHGLEGLKHMASSIVPPIYDPGVADRDERVSTEDAYRLVRRLARQEGLLVGPSAGAALAGCLRIADEVDQAVIVTIFPDRGDRYLSEGFWNGGDDVDSTMTPLDEVTETAEDQFAVPEAVLAAIRSHGASSFPDECCGALIGDEPGLVHRSARPLEHHVGRTAPPLPDRAGRVPRRRSPGHRNGQVADRLLPLAPEPSGDPVGIRSRARVAQPALRDRVGDGWTARSGADLAPADRSIGVR